MLFTRENKFSFLPNSLTKQGMIYDSAYRLEVYLPQLLYAEKIQSLKHQMTV